MTLLQILERAVKPRINQQVGTDLAQVAAWQAGLFGTFPPGTAAYPVRYASEAETLGLSVVGGFLNIVTGLVLQMPLHAYRGNRNIGNRVATDPAIIRNPAPGPGRTFAHWVEEYLRDIILHGNYVAVLGPPDKTGWPGFMYPVPCEQWTIVHTDVERGIYHYEVNGTPYAPVDIFHVRVNARTGELVGRGICELYAGLIASSVAAERWSATYFDGGAVPPAQIEHPNPDLTEEQAIALKAKYNAAVKAHEAVVTPAGTVVKPLSSNAEDAQLNDTRRQNMQQLAMAIGIPPALLGLDSPSLTYRNITDVFQQFITTTVMGLLVPLELQLTEQTLSRPLSAFFSANEVLRPDIAERVGIAVDGLAQGLFTATEARALVDLPPAEVTDLGQRILNDPAVVVTPTEA